MAGLTAAGLSVKTLDEIVATLTTKIAAAAGKSLDYSPNSVIGRVILAFAEEVAEAWELLEDVYGSHDPDKALGVALDAICAITGKLRKEAEKSFVTLSLTGVPTTVVPALSRARVNVTEELFETTSSAVIALVPSRAPTTAYSVEDYVTSFGNVYRCTVAGTTSAGSGPSQTDPDIAAIDGTAAWQFIGIGTGIITALATAVEYGPVIASARDIRTIDTPFAGWQGVLNLADAVIGNDTQKDEDLRIDRETSLPALGCGYPDAIRAELLALTGVKSSLVFTNRTDVTDVDGLPPHSIEALVWGGDAQAIFDTLLANVAAGIATYGNTSGSATDSQGFVHTMYYTVPTEINVWIEVELSVNVGTYPADGDSQVADAILAYGESQDMGRDVVPSAISAVCFGIPGVLDVNYVLVGTSSPPALSTPIVIQLRELAVYDLARIDVASVGGTP